MNYSLGKRNVKECGNKFLNPPLLSRSVPKLNGLSLFWPSFKPFQVRGNMFASFCSNSADRQTNVFAVSFIYKHEKLRSSDKKKTTWNTMTFSNVIVWSYQMSNSLTSNNRHSRPWKLFQMRNVSCITELWSQQLTSFFVEMCHCLVLHRPIFSRSVHNSNWSFKQRRHLLPQRRGYGWPEVTYSRQR